MPGNKKVKSLSFKYADKGGNINLIENGQIHHDGNFGDITSPTANGLQINVGGFPQGTLHLFDTMNKFHFTFPVAFFPVLQYTAVVGGGQELWIDDLEIELEP